MGSLSPVMSIGVILLEAVMRTIVTVKEWLGLQEEGLVGTAIYVIMCVVCIHVNIMSANQVNTTVVNSGGMNRGFPTEPLTTLHE